MVGTALRFKNKTKARFSSLLVTSVFVPKVFQLRERTVPTVDQSDSVTAYFLGQEKLIESIDRFSRSAQPKKFKECGGKSE